MGIYTMGHLSPLPKLPKKTEICFTRKKKKERSHRLELLSSQEWSLNYTKIHGKAKYKALVLPASP